MRLSNQFGCWCYRMVFLIGLILLLLLTLENAECKKHKKKYQGSLITRPEWKTRRNKNSECKLGGNRYALNSTWSPDLGPPFGVWGCVKCTCRPVRKKRRVVAKVVCRNVKRQCPKPKCDEPVLSPGACCKLCPGQGSTIPDEFLMQRHQPVNPDQLSEKDFAVLLNGRTSLSPVTSKQLATGRLFLRRGTLHFSFVLASETPSPAVVQFLTSNGNIMEEIEVQPTPYEVNNGRVCGTWTRVPRQYRNLLKKEEMWIELVTDTDTISGRIRRYKGVNTEIFSSLLSPDPDNQEKLPGGGTAIISVSAPSNSLHVSLVFNGVFQKSQYTNISLMVEFRPSKSLEPVREVVFLEKFYSDINTAEIMTTLGETSLRLLTRGKVSMKIWSPQAPELYLEGAVIARATCNVYSSILTTLPSQSVQQYGAGWALLFISNDGDFEYQIKLESLPSIVIAVAFETTGKKKIREVEDLTSNYKDGWVNGTYGKPTFRDLDMLLRGRLDVSVTMADDTSISGSFEYISATEALRSMYPTLLRADNFWMAATAWVAVDSACVMHYDVYLAGANVPGSMDPTWNLMLRENDTVWDPRPDQGNITLEHIITGREVATHSTLLNKVSLTRLMHGVSLLRLSVADSTKVFNDEYVISGSVKGVKVPSHCHIDSETNEKVVPRHGTQVDRPCSGFLCMLDERDGQTEVTSKKCIDDAKRVYEDGETWTSPVSVCHRCMCTLGKIKCQAEPCPKVTCKNGVIRPGECCLSCPPEDISDPRVCLMDKEEHSMGSFWHPFLAPKGFNLCVTCHCNLTSDNEQRIQCGWVKCPALPCLDSVAEIVEGSCCRRCPATTAPPYLPVIRGMLSDKKIGSNKRKEMMKEIILRRGGCLEREVSSFQEILHRNGETWQPSFNFRSRKRCVFCSCKDGQISCKSRSCKKYTDAKRKDTIKKKRKGRRNKKKKYIQ